MTIDATTTADDAGDSADDGMWLGSDVVRRMRLPGPPRRDVPRPAAIGSLASASSRFATSLARPVPTRQGLRGPEVASVQSFRHADMSPPRWWHPELVPPAPETEAEADRPLPRRGLPRAVHQVPSEGSRTPGGILGSLVSTVVPVRRMEAVVAAGPMLTSHDKARLTAATTGRAGAPPAAPPTRPVAVPRRSPRATADAPATPSSTAPDGPAEGSPPSPPAGPAAVADGPAQPTASTPPAPPAPPAPVPDAATGPDEPPAPPEATAPDDAPATDGPEPPRARWRPERISRLQATRTPAGPQLGVPRGVGVLAGVGAGALGTATMLAGGPRQLAPLRRMVGGGHAVSPSAAAANATVTTPGSVVGAAAWRRAEVPEPAPARPTAGRHRAVADAPFASTTAVDASTLAANGSAPAGSSSSAPGGVTGRAGGMPGAASAAATPDAAGIDGAAAAAMTNGAATSGAAATSDAATSGAATSDGPAPDVLAPGDAAPTLGRRRSATQAGPAGIALATARPFPGSAQPASAVRPALAATLLPAMAGGQAWLPGARQRAATAVGLTRPGDGIGEGRAGSALRARSFGMSDLLSTTSPLARDGESDRAARNGLATAFAAPDPIRPAGSAASAPAPPAGAVAADDVDAGDPDDGASPPLAAARRRAAARASSAASSAASSVASTGAPLIRSATGLTAPAAAPIGAAGAGGLLADVATRAQQRRASVSGLGAGTAATALSHLPAPPPMSLRPSSDGGGSTSGAALSAPPVPGSALVAGTGGALRRSLIDVTAGMFDTLATDSAGPSAGPPVPSSFGSQPEGADAMSGVQRRLAAVSDSGSTQPTAIGSPLDDAATMSALVDEVVERIEARVIDELERRGRRYNPGVF